MQYFIWISFYEYLYKLMEELDLADRFDLVPEVLLIPWYIIDDEVVIAGIVYDILLQLQFLRN